MISPKMLAEAIESSTIRTLSGPNKKAYRYFMAAIFLNFINGAHATQIQQANFAEAMSIRALSGKKQSVNEKYIEHLEEILFKDLEKSHFKKPYTPEFFNGIVSFFRDRLTALDQNQPSFFRVKELSHLIDTNIYFGYPQVTGYYWVEFDLVKGLIITIPEGIIFNDLKVQWNNFIDVRNKLSENRKEHKIPELDFHKDETNRTLLYSYGAFYRSSIFLAVTLVEAYLYNLFYSFKESNFTNQQGTISLLQSSQMKVQDTQIIENILYEIFPELKGKTEKLYKEYKKTLIFRDRYVHASATPDEADARKSNLQPLLDIHDNNLVKSLNNAIAFMIEIDKNMPEKYKLLFWWYDGQVDFSSFEKLSLTNPNARINNKSYWLKPDIDS